MHAPLTFEALTIIFFGVLAVAAPWTRAPRGRRRQAMLLFLGLASVVAVVAWALPPDIRIWLGHAYLVAGYRLPALLVPAGAPTAFDAWLSRTEARWLPFRPRLSPWAAHVMELSYLFCYLLVPAAFVFVWMTAAVDAANRFWTAVLGAGFVCYGALPWLVSHPPRVRRTAAPARATPLRRLNLGILGRASHGYNTFPSGHVAVSVAAALVVLSLSLPAGMIALVVAAGVGLGAQIGGYHYAIDVHLGMLVGVAAAALA